MTFTARIFVSYARSDGKDVAREICDRLREEENLKLWYDLADMEGGRDWWRQIAEAIDQVEHLVLIMTPNALTSEIVRREWRYARQVGCSVTPIMGGPELSFNDLPGWMRHHAFVEWWEPEAWTRLVRRLESEMKIPRVPFMAEDLPENFVPRRNELDELISKLVDKGQSEPVGISAALSGAGGYGKTTLARAICHNEAIQDAYFDGVLWVTLGEDPGELTGRIIDLIHILTGERETFETTIAATSRFKELLAERHLLLVIDDVWNQAHLRPFLEGGSNCARLITTRFATVIPSNASQTMVDAMQLDEAIGLLRPDAAPDADDALENLAKRLGQWPLLLKLAGAMLRRREMLGSCLDDALRWVNKALDRKGVTAFDAYDVKQRDQAVSKTLDASLDQLDDDERQLFVDLAVFPEDVDVPLATLELLWGLDDFETEEYCQRFFELGLLWSLDVVAQCLRLHDVVRAYLRAPDDDPRSFDAKLVTAYRERCGGAWYNAPDDGYVLEWLPSHLVGAGKHDELAKLLFDLRWLKRKLVGCGIDELIADAMLVCDDDEVDQLSRALRLSAHVLCHQPEQLPAQLIGRLDRTGGKRSGNLIAQAENSKPCDGLIPLGKRYLISSGPLIRIFQDHSSWVRGAVLLENDKCALSWSDDHTLRLWDLYSGQSQELEGHTDRIMGAVILSDGKRALSWSDDRTLRHWCLDSGQSMKLNGHSDMIEGAAIVDNGKGALSWSSDNTLRLWDLESGRSRELSGHRDSIKGAVILDDGKHALSWSFDNTLRLWDLGSGRSQELEGHSEAVEGATLLDDGKRVLSWSSDNTLRLWDLGSGRSKELRGHKDSVEGAVILDNGKRALSWSQDSALRLWDIESGRSRALQGHSDSVEGALILDNTKRALSWSCDNTLRLWDLDSGKSRELEGHSSWVQGAMILDDGRRALSWSLDNSLRVWNLDSGRSQALEGHSHSVFGAAIFSNGQRALSWSQDSTLRLWDLGDGESQALERCSDLDRDSGRSQALEEHSDLVEGAAILDDDKRALSWSRDSTLRLWCLTSGQSWALEGHGSSVEGAVVLSDGQRVLSWSQDGTLRLWDLSDGESQVLEGHSDLINGAVILDGGQRTLSWSQDSTLRLWDLESGQSQAFKGHTHRVSGVVPLNDGQRALSWSSDNMLRLWDLESGQSQALNGHSDSVEGAVILDDEKRALSWSFDNTLRLWDLDSGRSQTLEGHCNRVQGAAILWDGKRALSWSYDNTLRLWDLASGQSQAFEGHNDSIQGAMILDDGRHALSWSFDNVLRLWDLDSGRSQALEGHSRSIQGVVILDNGRRALSWSFDKTLRLWDLMSSTQTRCFVGDDALTTCVLSCDRRLALVGDRRGRVMFFALPES